MVTINIILYGVSQLDYLLYVITKFYVFITYVFAKYN